MVLKGMCLISYKYIQIMYIFLLIKYICTYRLFRFEANAELVRRQLRARNAVEGPERARAVIERAKLQRRYKL